MCVILKNADIKSGFVCLPTDRPQIALILHGGRINRNSGRDLHRNTAHCLGRAKGKHLHPFCKGAAVFERASMIKDLDLFPRPSGGHHREEHESRCVWETSKGGSFTYREDYDGIQDLCLRLSFVEKNN